jgi:hypothetical protein
MNITATIEFSAKGDNKKFYLRFNTDGEPEQIRPLFAETCKKSVGKWNQRAVEGFATLFLLLAAKEEYTELKTLRCEIAHGWSDDDDYCYFANWDSGTNKWTLRWKKKVTWASNDSKIWATAEKAEKKKTEKKN